MRFLFSSTALAGPVTLIWTSVVGVIGIQGIVSPIEFVAIAIATAPVVVWSWLASAKQNEDSEALKDDIDQIKHAVGIDDQKSEQITPKGIVEVLEAQKEAAIEATKSNFPLFRVAENDAQNPSGPIKVNLVSVGGPVFAINYWISPAANDRDASNEAYWSVDQRKPLIPVVQPNSQEWVRFLPAGDYVIEIDALTGHWNEYLSIRKEAGAISQTIKIVKANDVIYRFPPDLAPLT